MRRMLLRVKVPWHRKITGSKVSVRPAGAFAASPSRAQTAVNGATRADFPAHRLAQIGGMDDSRLSGGPPPGDIAQRTPAAGETNAM
jgi:hypothetical protein